MALTDAERVKERTDIVALIGEHVRLKKSGASFKGLCPFHQEDTPSFVVSPSRQMFHCFGCSESGDCFSWLMKREGMTFPEALRVLAQRAGIPLMFERSDRREDREKLRATLDTVVDFTHAILQRTAEGREARAYLTQRGMTNESIAAWRLGYVPPSGTPLVEKARERVVSADDLLRAGMLARGASGLTERFAGRVLFPLTDTHGSVVGFAGRILKDTPDRPLPKYVNTPETVLYTKGKILYGLDRARDAIRRAGVVVLVEGYTDVIASHQAGVANVVATSGTALTEDHLTLLKRFTDRIAFAFDADTAGSDATRRAIDAAHAQGFVVSVIPLPAGEDPADLSLRDPAAWRARVDSPQDVFAFLLARALAMHPPTDAAGKRAIAQDLLPLLARVADGVVRGAYLQQLAQAVRVEPRFLHEDLERIRRTDQPAPRVTAPAGSATVPTDPTIRREERLLALFFVAPVVFPVAREHLPPAAFIGAHTRQLYAALLTWYDRQRVAGTPGDLAHVREELPPDLRRLVDVLELGLEAEVDDAFPLQPDRDARVLLKDLLVTYRRRTLADITAELEHASPERRPVLLRDVATATDELARAEHLMTMSEPR